MDCTSSSSQDCEFYKSCNKFFTTVQTSTIVKENLAPNEVVLSNEVMKYTLAVLGTKSFEAL